MNLLKRKLEIRDVIALLVILGALITNWRGGNFMVPASVMIIIGFYFGAEHQKSISRSKEEQKTYDEKL